MKTTVFILTRHVAVCIIGLLCLHAQAQPLYQKPALQYPDSWSMVLIPDPQNYVKYLRNQPVLDLMTAWIVENIDSLNIKMVMCTGDLVEQNDRINRGVSGNQSSAKQWEACARSFAKLDGVVPYITATGNHDYTYKDDGRRVSHFREYFYIDKNPLNRKIICQDMPNEEGELSLENSAYEFVSSHGTKFLLMTIEFAPRNAVIAWAKKVVDMPQYNHHKVILLTHAYLNANNKRINHEIQVTGYLPYAENGDILKKRQALPDANNGEDIWEKLIKPSRNIELVMCGHIGARDDFRAHVGFRTDKNDFGKTVNQMVFNAQFMGGGHYGSGGDGWLRILEFLPDGKTIHVRTFSPFFAVSPSTRQSAWSREAYNEFSFTFD